MEIELTEGQLMMIRNALLCQRTECRVSEEGNKEVDRKIHEIQRAKENEEPVLVK